MGGFPLSPSQIEYVATVSIASVCVALASLFALRATLGLLLVLLSRVPGATGQWAGRAAARVLPRILRGLLAGTLAVSGSAAAAGAASATPLGMDTQTVGTQTVGTAASGHLPILDRITVWPTGSPSSSETPGGERAVPPKQSAAKQSAAKPMPPKPMPPKPLPPKPSPPTKQHTLVSQSPAPHADRECSVVVRPGDSLWTIARSHLSDSASDADIAAEWPLWWQENKKAVGSDPSLIRPGLVLHSPHC